jgi:hypothetical protein
LPILCDLRTGAVNDRPVVPDEILRLGVHELLRDGLADGDKLDTCIRANTIFGR